MIGTPGKILAALAIGFLVGLLSGTLLGLPFGLALGVFFLEIVNARQTILMSILLSLVLGGLLGWAAVYLINRRDETEDRPVAGIAAGAVVGLFVSVFLYGYIVFPDPSSFEQTLYTVPIYYSVSVGAQIGASLFPLLGAAAVVRDLRQTAAARRDHARAQLKDQNELSFYKSQKPGGDA